MSTTRGNVKKNVRAMFGDQNASNYALSSERLERIIQNRVHAIARLVGLPETAVLTQGNVQAGDSDYEFYIATVPGSPSAEYQQILELRTVDANGVISAPVPRRPIEDLRAMQANHATTVTGSELMCYAAFNRTSSTATTLNRTYISTYPARGSLGLRIRVANIPARYTSDDDLIPFNDSLVEALEFDVAFHAVAQMRGSELARNLADAGTLSAWKEAAQQGIIGERRQNAMTQRSPGVVMVRR